MNVFCYVRTAHKTPKIREEQAAEIRQEAERKGFDVANTGSAALDSKLLGLLQSNKTKIQQAVIMFRE